MRVGSLFSGVEGFGLGLERSGMEIIWQVEQDKDCLKVLRRHFPETKRYYDVKEVGKANLTPVDLICGGAPCQDVSVAGKRAGLAGERTGLWFEMLRIIAELKPGWVLFENVPGLLSSNDGRDFATIISGLEECGYGWAYRVLDSQFFGVAQRRRRVFLVGSIGSASASQVLFESSCRCGDTPTRREAGERVAGTPGGGPADSRRGFTEPAYALNAHGGSGRCDGESESFICYENHAQDSRVREIEKPTLHAKDGTGGNNLPLIAIQDCREMEKNQNGLGVNEGDIAYTLDQTGAQGVCIPIDTRNATRTTDPSEMNRQELGVGKDGDPSPTLTDVFTPAVAFAYDDLNQQINEEISPSLRIGKDSGDCVAQQVQWASGGGQILNDTAQALRSGAEHNYQFVQTPMLVRRLTPTECERLQAFPDGWTSWGLDEKGNRVELSDSARYRMLGNAVTVNVAEWIGKQIMEAMGAEKR